MHRLQNSCLPRPQSLKWSRDSYRHPTADEVQLLTDVAGDAEEQILHRSRSRHDCKIPAYGLSSRSWAGTNSASSTT